MLSVVIPTLDAAESIGPVLDTLGRPPWAGLAGEVVVSDGGSIDRTRELAEARGAVVVAAAQGRGPQLRAGAERARGDWLLFLHADTRPQPGWAEAVADYVAAPGNRRRAAAFAFKLDDASADAHRLERLVAWRCRRLGLPYGDQGLLIARAFYEELGGYRAIPLMEDVDLVRRIGRRRLDILPASAVTSAERWRREGWYRRSARNLLCLGLYFAGVRPETILRLYR